MKVKLRRIKNSSYFEAENESGHTIHISGDKDAVAPMQSVLMAAASCSAIDIVLILGKMRQKLEDIQVEVEGTRREEIPRIFTHIHLHYILKGRIKEKKAAQAVELSMTKYCSVTKMLEKSVELSYSYELIEEEKNDKQD